jgi:hypothetical protein
LNGALEAPYPLDEMEEEFAVEAFSEKNGVLTVVCQGFFAHYPSIDLIKESVEKWMGKHPEETVEEIVLDLAAVDYVGGDGPASSIMGFRRKGVKKFRLIPNPKNRALLESLVNGLGWQ